MPSVAYMTSLPWARNGNRERRGGGWSQTKSSFDVALEQPIDIPAGCRVHVYVQSEDIPYVMTNVSAYVCLCGIVCMQCAMTRYSSTPLHVCHDAVRRR